MKARPVLSNPHSHLDRIGSEPAEKILRAALHDWTHDPRSRPAALTRSFVTISRQPGAGGLNFSHHLAARLNELQGSGWSAWDQELIEKVSAEEGIAKQIVAMIQDRPHTWMQEILEAFSSSEDSQKTAELHVYKRIAMTIRALARAGHAVIVGQGGRFITARMDGGIHLRLVAPLEDRIRFTADRFKITPAEATKRVEEREHNRQRFLRRYWPGKSLAPENFALTLNVGELSVAEMVEAVVPIIVDRERI
jgi:cytidylate kinase